MQVVPGPYISKLEADVYGFQTITPRKREKHKGWVNIQTTLKYRATSGSGKRFVLHSPFRCSGSIYRIGCDDLTGVCKRLVPS